MRLWLGDESLAAIDALTDVELMLLFVAEDERPLQGLPGLADWRSCGALSRHLRAEHYRGAPGEKLLYLGKRPGAMGRLLCFGIGGREGRNAERSRQLLEGAAQALADAKVSSAVTSLGPFASSVEGGPEGEEGLPLLMKALLSAIGRASPALRLGLLGREYQLRPRAERVARELSGVELERSMR